MIAGLAAPPLEPEELADRLRRAPWRRYVTIGDSLTEGLGDPVEGYPIGAFRSLESSNLSPSVYGPGRKFSMAPVIESIEIDRPPEEVFAYLDDLSRHGEWQTQIESVRVDTDGPTRVGTRVTEKRKVPGGAREFTYEITEHEPPRLAAFEVQNGPVRPFGRITIEPSGAGSRYTLELDFKGVGLGKLIAPLARRDARRHVPEDLARFKEKVESGAAAES